MPGLTTDWYELYKNWCSKHGHRAAPEAKFVTPLMRQRNVVKKRCRYNVAGRERGPHYFLLLGQTEPPEGQAQAGQPLLQRRARTAARVPGQVAAQGETRSVHPVQGAVQVA